MDDSKLIEGKKYSLQLRAEIKEYVDQQVSNNIRRPKLVVVQVGHNPASDIYIRNKKTACEKAGVLFNHVELAETITEQELLHHVDILNQDNEVDGFIVQLPLPKHIDADKVTDTILPTKDADGFTPIILGNIMLNKTEIAPATPKGIIKLLEWKGINVLGKNVTIVGRSNIVGKPLSNMLINRSATVTVCNTKTKDLKAKCLDADILISAAGSAGLIKEDMVKQGAVVIDVGTNKVDDKFVGDVDFDNVINKASLITPVPGGVGPMTILSLLDNLISLYKEHIK